MRADGRPEAISTIQGSPERDNDDALPRNPGTDGSPRFGRDTIVQSKSHTVEDRLVGIRIAICAGRHCS